MLGPILSFAGGIADNLFANKRQDEAQTFSASQFASRYQTTVKDMEAAGLNPALAYQQGGGSSPSGVVSSPGNQMSNVGSAYMQSKLNDAQVDNVKADTMNKLESAALIRAQAAQASSSASQADAQTTKIGQEVTNLKEQFKNIPLEGSRLKALADQLNSSSGLMLQQGATQQQVRDHLRAMISKLKSETELLDLDIDAAQSLGNIGREYKQLQPIVDLIRSFIRK